MVVPRVSSGHEADPLHLFLLVLVMELLNGLLVNVSEFDLVEVLKFGSTGMGITSLLFADKMIIFYIFDK